MLRMFVLTTALAGLQVQSFEPARLQNGVIQPVKFMAAAAGMVLMELTVDERGLVRDSRPIQDVAPFTGLVQDSVKQWRFEPARVNRVKSEARVLVIGLFRPAALLFPVPELPKAPPGDDEIEIPFPTEIVVPPYPPNNIGSVNVLVEVEVGADGSVGSTKTLTPQSGFDVSATSTARAWRFRPAELSDKPVASRIYMIVSYRQPL